MSQAVTQRSVALQPALLAAPRFTGRSQELAALTAALAGRPAVVLVEGEAGIGKTRLIREYLTTPQGKASKALVATCPPFRQPHTLGPVVDALRQEAVDGVLGLPLSGLAGALRPLFPEWAADLPPAPEPPGDATIGQHRLFRALDELLGCLGVALLAVEDAHWADDATLEFLLYLDARRPQPLSLAVTYRPEDMPADSLLARLSSRLSPGTTRLRLALEPLDVTDTAEMVSSMLAGEHVSGGFAEFLHERTEGVPLAIEESLRLLADRGDMVKHDGGWARRHLADITVPPTIRDAVRERAGRLSADGQAVLAAAAVLGDAADLAIVQAVAGLDETRAGAGLSEALGCGLLGEDTRGQVSFRHALASRAVYEALSAPQRKALHLCAGEALEAAAPSRMSGLAQLARHFREAGDTGRWRMYGEQAAERAVDSGDEAAAVAMIYDLITGTESTTRHDTELLDRLMFVSLTGTTVYRDLAAALGSALASAAFPPEEEAQIRFQRARLLRLLNEQEASRAEATRAVPHLVGDPLRAAKAMTMLGWAHATTCPASEHLRWLRRAAALMESLRPEDRLILQVERTTALLLLGREEGWAEAALVPAGGATAPVRVLSTLGQLNLSDHAMVWGRYAEARRRIARALELAETNEHVRYRLCILSTQVHLDWFTGAWDGLAERARQLADDDQVSPNDRAECALVDGLLQAAAGAKAEAERRVRSVLAERLRQGQMAQAVEPAAAVAAMALAEGRVTDALTVTEEPVRVVVAKGTWVWAAELAPVRVAALVADGKDGQATELVAAFTRGLRGRDAPSPRAGLLLCRALLAQARGEHARAAAAFARAAIAWQALPRPYDALLARERQGCCLLRAGKREPGLALLTEVFGELSELGARGDAVRVMNTLREHEVHVRRPWWGGRTGYGDDLSPRELDVVRLLVGGRTNREIGEALFLSPRTVARHLDGAMRKLRVRSRTALAMRVVEEGIVPAADSKLGH